MSKSSRSDDKGILERNVSSLLETGGEAPRIADGARSRIRVHLIDPVGRKKYFVARDSDKDRDASIVPQPSMSCAYLCSRLSSCKGNKGYGTSKIGGIDPALTLEVFPYEIPRAGGLFDATHISRVSAEPECIYCGFYVRFEGHQHSPVSMIRRGCDNQRDHDRTTGHKGRVAVGVVETGVWDGRKYRRRGCPRRSDSGSALNCEGERTAILIHECHLEGIAQEAGRGGVERRGLVGET